MKSRWEMGAASSELAPRTGRVRWLILISFAALGLCFARLMYLQLIKGAALARAAESNHTQILIERAPRGRILDRNGVILADDQPVFVALFSPVGLQVRDFSRVKERLAPIIQMDPEDLDKRLQSAKRSKVMIRIADRLTREQAFLILQDRVRLPGVSLTTEEQRYYPQGSLAAHVLGYVGPITENELNRFEGKGYQMGDWIGKSGLERIYDPALQGKDGGFLMQVDARGRQIKLLRHVPPVAGRDVVLTLDSKIQKVAEEKLLATGLAGAAIVMKPQTGEVLALASSPTFDPNVFLPLGDSQKRKDLLSDPKKPLFNRAVQAVYPPGSVFKIVSSLAGWKKGVIRPDEQIRCTGSVVMGLEKRVFRCWLKGGHGWVNFRKAMEQSCDVYFYQQGLRIGSETLDAMGKECGLGQISGLDLPSEAAGSLPYAWRKSRGEYWTAGETFNYVIGQGALQVTPLQMAWLLSGVSTRGLFMQPYLASETRFFNRPAESLNSAKLAHRVDLSASIWDAVQQSLVQVVQTGTGIASRLDGIEVAGKTGTAQVAKNREDHAWFAAYAPAQEAQVACAVLVENGGHGGAVAAPIVRFLLAQALGVQVGKSIVAVDAD